MKKNIREYFNILKNILNDISVTGINGEVYRIDEAIDKVIDMVVKQACSGKKVLFIGNGASASIASHMAVDFWKNGGIKAIAFNDASLLTCISNDYGYKHVFEKPIEIFIDSGDILFAISSSGKSENILRGAEEAKKKAAILITLSGFAKDNPLRKLGLINFYVPSNSYGHVEVVHHSICHSVVDNIVLKKNKNIG